MALVHKFKFYLYLWLVNVPLHGSHFFRLKRYLLTQVGIKIGIATKVVGPIKVTSAASLVIGSGCWIGENFQVYGDGKVVIGNQNDFGPEVTFLTGSHEIGPSSRRAGKGVNETFQVGNGNWVGAKSVFIKGASVSSGIVIGARSLINKDCESNSVYVGSPIRKLRLLDKN